MKPKKLIRQWFERIWNEGDLSMVKEGFAKSGVMTGLADQPIVGRDGYIEFHRTMNAAFDGFRCDVVEFVDDGDSFAGCVNVRATHKATGREVEFQSFFIGEVEDGKIVRAHNLTDHHAVLTQIGAVKEDALSKALAAR